MFCHFLTNLLLFLKYLCIQVCVCHILPFGICWRYLKLRFWDSGVFLADDAYFNYLNIDRLENSNFLKYMSCLLLK